MFEPTVTPLVMYPPNIRIENIVTTHPKLRHTNEIFSQRHVRENLSKPLEKHVTAFKYSLSLSLSSDTDGRLKYKILLEFSLSDSVSKKEFSLIS